MSITQTCESKDAGTPREADPSRVLQPREESKTSSDARADGTIAAPAVSQANRRRRRTWIACVVLLSLVTVSLAGAFAYSTVTAQRWKDEAEQTAIQLQATQQDRDSVKGALTKSQAELSSTKQSLSDVTTKYNDAIARTRALSDEKAKVGDQAGLLTEALALSQKVGSELDACISDLRTMETYLVNWQAYDSQALLSYVQDVNNKCNAAQADNAALAKKLGGK